MAKIFYTVDEACTKLGKTNDQVMELISSGKLREFRDRGQLMLKVEDVNSLSTDAASDSGLDLKLAANVGEGSDSFELDLSDSATPPLAGDPKGDSPVGLAAPAGIKDDHDELSLEFDSKTDAPSPPSAAKSKAGASKANAPKVDSDELSLELEPDESNASASPAASAAKSGTSNAPPAIDDDSLTLELDLSDSVPAAATPPKKPGAAPAEDSEALFLEDSLASGIAASPAKSSAGKSAHDLNQTIEDSRAESAGAYDSNIDSVAGTSAGLEADKINLDQPGSGSGLLDLTQESEDSQMGAALMDEAFQGDDEEALKNASGIFGGAAGESGINEAAIVNTGSIAAVPAFAGAAVAGVETYSGAWSGLTVGLLVPAIVGLTATAAMLVMKTLGGTPELAIMFARDWMMWTGGYAGIIAVSGAIGFFVGKATE